MNVLITSASRKVSLVKTFKRALEHNQGGKVIAIDVNPLSPALYFADDYFMVPFSKNPEFMKTILNLCEDFNIQLVIPTRDEELILFAQNKERFTEIGTWVMVSDPKTIKICQDKDLFVDFCKKNNFKIPKTYENNNDLSELQFPLFIKPKMGKGGIQTFKANTEEELNQILKLVEDPIIQEYIDAPEYTVDLFADFSGKVISAVPRERINVWGGESLVTKTFKNQVMIKETVKLAENLNLLGHNTIQCFFKNNEVIFIEVNPRFGGAASLSFEAGADSPSFLIKLIEGKDLKPIIGEFKEDLIALRYVEDLFIGENSLEERRSS
jgi:carbamoyl-phosphate synthase large subunit